MKRTYFSVLGAGLLCAGASQAKAQDHHGHTMCDPTAAPKAILSTPDFDGDGVVTPDDIAELGQQVDSGVYTAFFDVNADGVLNGRDVSIASRAVGAESSLLDQQLTTLFWATERYRDIGNAFADGFRPYTPIFEGHGKHYSRMPVMFQGTDTNGDGVPDEPVYVDTNGDGIPDNVALDPTYQNTQDTNLDLTVPEGLNYDENGNLVAVYFHHGADTGLLTRLFVYYLGLMAQGQVEAAQAILPQIDALQAQGIEIAVTSAMYGGAWPYLFDSEEARWHQHFGSCYDELDYFAKTFNPFLVGTYTESATPDECHSRPGPGEGPSGWLSAYNMLHVWLYTLNPCGVFAGENPEVATEYPAPADTLYRSTEEWFDVMGIGHLYPYGMGMGH